MGPFAPAVTWRTTKGLGSHSSDHAVLKKEHYGQRALECNAGGPSPGAKGQGPGPGATVEGTN